MPPPKDIIERYRQTLNAWRTLRPDKTFGGMTLTQFEAACVPSLTTRANLEVLQDKVAQEIADRNAADGTTADVIARVAAGILADPDEGDDSPLYGALGYTRKSERKTGLTRKRKEPAKT
jgi:hypothetical protein